MKIWINGIIRDMTQEEEALYFQNQENQPDHEDFEELLNILIGEEE